MAKSHRHGGDRLSALPDSALVRVLSHLPSDEAVRSSALSRRWLDLHEAVPVVNLVDTKKGERCGGDLKVCFDHQVTSAILSKGMTTPIRAFRLSVLDPPYDLLDQWIATVVTSGVEDLDVKLRYKYVTHMRTLCPLASAESDTRGGRYTRTHRRIFSCPTLSRLRLKGWTLDLPSTGVVMESLETLCLARIMDPYGLLQELVSSCPRLVHLTLQECPSIQEITVPSPRLRSFAMICCHNAGSVDLTSTCVQSLHYKGGLPPRGSASFLTVASYQGIKAVTIEICENLCTKGPRDVAPVTGLVRRCTRLAYLHLSLRPAMAFYNSMFTSVLRDQRCLTHLSLQGCLHTDHAIMSVAALILNTRNLQVLSLFPLAPKPPEKTPYYLINRETDSDLDIDSEPDRHLEGESDTDQNSQPDRKPKDGAANNGVRYSTRIPESLWRMYVRCLDRSVRRINIGNYTGHHLEKMLARFLLSRAATLEEFSVSLAARLYPHKDEIANELASWRWNSSTRVTCNKSQRRKI